MQIEGMLPDMMDNGLRYGLVTRALHWGIAGFLLYQLGGVIAGSLLGETPLTEAWGSSHKAVGLLLFVLAVVRAVWGLINLGRRPAAHPGLLGKVAVASHLVLYGLLLFVPGVALLRQYGSGRPFEAFGLSVMQGGHDRIEWMTKLGSDFHGEMAWVLLALLAGHIVMALVHRFVWKDDTFKRMAG